VSLPVSNVVEEGGKLDNQEIGSLGLADPLGHPPNPVNMPPVVAGAVVRELGFHVVGGAVNELG
jgi:hypothetical protein